MDLPRFAFDPPGGGVDPSQPGDGAPVTAKRRPGFGIRMVLIWAGLCALLVLVNAVKIAGLQFPDPDDIMRLVQVRDLLAGQGWFDLTQHRTNAPAGGVPMHWSRLVDVPLALVIGLLTPLLGQTAAELVANVGVPLIALGCALLLVGRLARRMAGEESALFACLALALSVPVIAQFLPLRIDHHGWQIVYGLLAANALMSRRARLGGHVAGLALATWMAISIEGLPLAAAIGGIAALRWLRDREDRVWLASLLQALALGSAALFVATRGFGDLATHCDAISPVHLAAFGAAALGVTLLALFDPPARWTIVAGLGISAGAAAATLLGVAPSCAGGGFANLDPLVRTYWYEGVTEGLPIWRHPPDIILQAMVMPLVGLFAVWRLAIRSDGRLRRLWIDYGLLLLAAVAVSVFVSRAAGAAGAFAAVPVGWQLREWFAGARSAPSAGKRLLALLAIVLAMSPALPLKLAAMVMPEEAVVASPRASSCRIAESARLLRALPQGEVLAPIDIAPSILLETRHRVIATGHHRGDRGMREVIAMFIGSPEHARRALATRGTAYLALCTDLAEPTRYASAAPEGFAARLVAGERFPWLEPVPLASRSSLKVWKIRP